MTNDSCDLFLDECLYSGATVYGREFFFNPDGKKQVLLVSNELSFTGAPIALGAFANSLKKTGGVLPVLVSFFDGPYRGELLENGITTIVIPRDKCPEFVKKIRRQFDLIISNTLLTANIVNALNGTDTPVFWWIHENKMQYASDCLKDVPDFLLPNVCVAAVGKRAKANLLRYKPNFNVNELLYYIDDSERENKVYNLGVNLNGKTVFSVIGSLLPTKGQDIFLDSIKWLDEKTLSKCYFVVVGKSFSDDILKKLKRIIEIYPENISYIEEISHKDMPSFYGAVDCVISTSRDDAMPIVITEAMRENKLIIVSENIGQADLIREYNAGLIYENNSSKELSEAIKKVINNSSDKFDLMRLNGRKIYVEFFTEDVFASKIKPQLDFVISNSISKNILKRISDSLHDEKNEITKLDDEIHKLRNDNQILLNSTSWKITKPLRMCGDVEKYIKHNLNKSTIKNAIKFLAKNGIKETTLRIKHHKICSCTYQDVSNRLIFSRYVLKKQRKTCFPQEITISIITPLYNTPENFLKEMIASVQNQTYSKWELCLADGSDNEHTYVEDICREQCSRDKRIKYIKLEENLGISENTNAAIKLSTGEYLALLDHDDRLHPSALHEVMKAICSGDADFIYTDECLFTDTPEDAHAVHFKPDFAPDNLLANNYICHFSVFSRKILEKTGGFKSEYDGSQDHDFVLRATDEAKCIAHIPEVLYFWRAHKESTASVNSAKPYAAVAGQKAVRDYLTGHGKHVNVTSADVCPTVYRIEYEFTSHPKVSIIIPNCEHTDVLKKCICSILTKTTYDNFEIVVVENNSKSKEIFNYYDSLEKEYKNVKVVNYDEGCNDEFNVSSICNFGAGESDGEILLFLDNDVEVITPEWIEEMLMYACRPDVGAVGAKLYYPNNTIQHAGILLGSRGVAENICQHEPRDHVGYMLRLSYAQNVTAVTAACLMLRRSVFDEINGFDPEFAAYNDVDICTRIRNKGYLNIWTPFSELYHHEALDRGKDYTTENRERYAKEVRLFQERHSDELKYGDPYYNPNFKLDGASFFLKGMSIQYEIRYFKHEELIT